MYKKKLENGNVEYLERFRDPMTGKTRYISITLRPRGKRIDEHAARAAIDQKIADLLSRAGRPEDITFSELVSRRAAWQKDHDKPQTYDSSVSYLRTMTRIVGGDTLISSLNAAIVYDRLKCDSPVTFNERLKHFKSLMRWGYRFDLVADISYLDKLQRRKEPPVREKDRYKYLEHDEIAKLLEGMAVEKWRILTEFLILSGLRIGEAIALDNTDVDLDAREISVTKTWNLRIGGATSTKTETSDRVVYMQDELLSCCHRIKQFVRIDKMKYAYRSKVFLPDEDGNHIQYGAYNKYFRENTKRILGRPLTPHSLRHTHTAMLAEAGIPLDDISRRLGHANSKITREVYLHVTSRMQEKAREKIREVKIVG